ncbi:glycoside hydrolase family 5 protein [Pseudoxanthomonas sacheonensis]|uniref:glycoside hydrolase family 5 protein n=1 Tax=Pseudoxanthomonas sacheonensis TaxID=443615 RepID=UPI0013D3742D|nr:glycoside hydrolase family 5 protein [Pseudoxanthomonas sacheonensis]KAF1709036.1 cellulase [Pseudoxanthomonas sacheonensis]
MRLHALPHCRIAIVACLLLLSANLSPASAQTTRVLEYAGVNLAGAEFNSSKKPGVLYKDYTYPSESDYAYYASKGMNVIRLPFLWERLQPQANGALDSQQLSYLQTAVKRAKAQNLRVVLDVHNYARYYGSRIGTAETPVAVFADFWSRLAAEFKDDDSVIFGLMNEPNGIDAKSWADAAQAGLNAIRAAGANNLVLVPGTAYSGAHSWNGAWYGGTSNGEALLVITDPANRIAFEAHQYLDADYSGTSGQCQSEQIGVQKLQGFTAWLREHHKAGFLGEFAAGSDPVCMAALESMLEYIETNADVWLGWTYWAGGAWWKPDYPFNVQPDKEGNEKPQMTVLSKKAHQVTD